MKDNELSPSGPLCYCRFCGQEKLELVSVHSDSLQYIMRKALQYFSIQISRQDILPQGICLYCLDQLYSCVQYIDKYEEAQTKLTVMLEKEHTFASNFQGINETTDAAVVSIIQTVNDECDKNRKAAELSQQNQCLCDLCGKCFATLHNLRRHRKTHLSDDLRKPHICETCSKSFCTRADLAEHENIHKDVKPYSCPVCSKSFHRKAVMRQHSLTHNVRPHKYQCEKCNGKFHRRSRFMHHMKQHNKQEITCPKSYQCSICAEIFPHVSSLYNHRKLNHSDERINEESTISKGNYPCNICDKLLANKRSLLYHQKAVHTQERPFVCLSCDTGFMSKFSYNIHMRKHTGEKPYRCSECKATFRSYAPLKRHQIRMHNSTICNNNNNPLKCLFCLRVFNHRIALHNHVATHISSNQAPLVNNQLSPDDN